MTYPLQRASERLVAAMGLVMRLTKLCTGFPDAVPLNHSRRRAG
jgi:hypothetical protein